MDVFDYHSDEVFNACLDKYLVGYHNGKEIFILNLFNLDTIGSDVDLSAEGARAEIFQIASVISRKLHPAFIYSFELEGHESHADDSDFMNGLHLSLNSTNWKENYMLNYAPRIVERFIKYGVPDEGV